MGGGLTAEAGAVMQKGIRIDEEQLWAEAEHTTSPDVTAVTSAPTTPKPTAGQRRADARLLVAQSALDHPLRRGSGGDRTQVVVHVDARALEDEN